MDGAFDQLRSLLGIVAIIGIGVLCSEDRRAIRWRVVWSGLALQFVFAVLVLKTSPGQAFFAWLGACVEATIDYTAEGAKFIFNDLAAKELGAGGVFAFKILPSVIFVGALMSVLYHLGIMQRIVQGMSWVMVRAMGVSGAEALAAAVNIFVGQTEAPLVIRPYLADMTTSELMAVMVPGFASIAGGVLVAYVSMGISAEHLIAASVMSAPAALVMSKLFVPEKGAPRTMGEGYVALEKVSVNVLDAAATGASDGTKLAINVAGMLIAFVAFVALFNGVLSQIGGWIGFPDLSLAWILGRAFSPLAVAIGVPWEDKFTYGTLLGTQVTLTEFIAYQDLAKLLPGGLEPGGFSTRSALLATYSLCGFANIGSIGIQLGGIGSLVESRRHELARLALRAMFAGFLTCNLMACIAGVLTTNAEADYRHARELARRAVARGELEPALRALRHAAERNPGSDWGTRAAEGAAKVEAWKKDVEAGKRPLDEVKKERP